MLVMQFKGKCVVSVAIALRITEIWENILQVFKNRYLFQERSYSFHCCKSMFSTCIILVSLFLALINLNENIKYHSCWNDSLSSMATIVSWLLIQRYSKINESILWELVSCMEMVTKHIAYCVNFWRNVCYKGFSLFCCSSSTSVTPKELPLP